MKKLIIGALTMASTIAATAAEYQTDTFKTKGGKAVVITAIKHASLRIQYAGCEIQVDPVAEFSPVTDYSKFPKADVILVTHEHFDHFDRSAITALKKDGTEVVANPAVQKILGSGTALANGESHVVAKVIKLDAVPAVSDRRALRRPHDVLHLLERIACVDGERPLWPVRVLCGRERRARNRRCGAWFLDGKMIWIGKSALSKKADAFKAGLVYKHQMNHGVS